MYFLLKSIDAIIIIKANTKKFSISRLSLIMTKRMQVKTMGGTSGSVGDDLPPPPQVQMNKILSSSQNFLIIFSIIN